MLQDVIGTKLDYSKPSWPRPDKTLEVPLEFKFLGSEPRIVITATNDLEAHVGVTREEVRQWASNWNTPTNTSGTISATLAISNEPHVVYVCNRNGCNRPWLDELSEIQPPVIRVIGEPCATGVTVITEPVARGVQRLGAPSRQKELEWLSSHTEKLTVYEGNWIALDGDKIVASGSDEVEVEMRARTKGVEVPLLFRVPSRGDKPFIGRSLHDSNDIR